MGCGQVFTLGEDVYGGNIAAPSGDLYPRSGYSPQDDMAHIARHDPARVLRDVAATRTVVRLHVPVDPDEPDIADVYEPQICQTCGSGEPNEYPRPWPCATLLAVASVWSDHPDYRQEWTP